jgi:hypothetical protein
MKKLYRKIFFEIYFYPERVRKYKTLWLWGSKMKAVRQADKRKRYRQKGYARLRNKKANIK